MSKYHKYDNGILKKVQTIQTEILSDLDKLCASKGWTYFVFGGTALGAVRHDGFIPWDDDVDVVMPRKDFDSLLEYYGNCDDGRNSLMHIENEKDYVLTFAKLMRKGTVFSEKNMCEHRYVSGIYIDIFPYDETSSDVHKNHLQKKRTWIYKMLCMSNRYSKYMNINDGTFKGLIVTVMFGLSHFWMKLFGISKETIYGKYLKWATKYTGTGSRLYMNFSDNAPVKINFTFSEEDIFPLIRHNFENIMVNVMHNYDDVLTKQYGDYMTLPPEEERENHCPDVIDFGE